MYLLCENGRILSQLGHVLTSYGKQVSIHISNRCPMAFKSDLCQKIKHPLCEAALFDNGTWLKRKRISKL